QLLQQAITIVDEARVRRVDERKARRITELERRHLQDDAGKIGAQHFRRRERGPCQEVLFGIEPYTNTVAFAPGAALALIGARLRDLLDRQTLHLAAHAVATDTGEARVNDVADAGHGERG